MSDLVVDVVFRGRVLETVPFSPAGLRIGRMPENDVVLDNLGVSRFHARLVREEGRVFLEDAGSENGCLLNGERVVGRRSLAPGDTIGIGKHELRVRRAAEGDDENRRPARRKSDAWDGGRTYVLDAPPRASAAPLPLPRPSSQPIPEPKEPIAMAPIASKKSAAAPAPVALPPTQEIDFDFVGALAAEEDAESPETMRFEAPTPPASATPPAPLYAGFIVQRQGKLERVVPWSADVLVAGRSADCDLHLAQDEISRRHVRFERKGEHYEVIDLGSVNGTFVNGKRIERHALSADDVVQVEGFQLTFVLDRNPLDGAFTAQPAVRPAQREDTFAMTMLQEQMPHRPGFTEILEKPGPGEEPPIAEADLLPDDIEEIVASADEDEKPAEVTSVRGSSRASSVQDLGRSSQPNLGGELRLELRVRVDLLPPNLRRAFEEAGASELVLPAELRLKTS